MTYKCHCIIARRETKTSQPFLFYVCAVEFWRPTSFLDHRCSIVIGYGTGVRLVGHDPQVLLSIPHGMIV